MLLGWTAAYVIFLVGAIIAVLGALSIASLLMRPGAGRTAMQIALAILGLIVATLVLWR